MSHHLPVIVALSVCLIGCSDRDDGYPYQDITHLEIHKGTRFQTPEKRSQNIHLLYSDLTAESGPIIAYPVHGVDVPLEADGKKGRSVVHLDNINIVEGNYVVEFEQKENGDFRLTFKRTERERPTPE